MLVIRGRTLKYGLTVLCVCILLVSCKDPIGGTGKSPVFLIAEGTTNWGLMIDVYNPGSPGNATDEFFDVTITSIYKDPTATTTVYADVIIQEYRITYYRIDGNPNVPDPIVFHLSARVPAGGTDQLNLHFLRREAKLESPLKELAFGGGEGAIEFSALVEFFGEDLMGNAVSTSLVLDFTATDL